jgi:hypothetical protein
MKNILKNSLLFAFLFLSNFTLQAQTSPGQTDDTGTLESTEAPAAPIDDYLLWIGIVGTLYAGYYFYSSIKKTVKTD